MRILNRDGAIKELGKSFLIIPKNKIFKQERFYYKDKFCKCNNFTRKCDRGNKCRKGKVYFVAGEDK